jgi:hypothetical protein
MLRIVLAIPFLPHGLAHLSGFLASWTRAGAGYTDKPWIFSENVQLQSWVGRIFGILWVVAMVGLVGTGVGIITRQAWWPSLAIAASAISLVVILPWWNTVPPGAKVGAAFDLLVIAVLLSPLQERLAQMFR